MAKTPHRIQQCKSIWKECSWKRNCLLGALRRTEDLGSVFSDSVYRDDYSSGSRGPGYTSGLQQNLTSFRYLFILQACKIQGRSVMEACTKGPVSCWGQASYSKIGFLIWNSWVGYVQNWEGEVEVAVEDPGYWRCQSRGMFTEKMAGTDWGQSTRVTHRQTTEKIRDPKSIRAQMMPPAAPDAGHEATGFGACPVGFCFCFSQSFPDVAPFFPFEIRMATMWYIWRMWLWVFGQNGDYWDLGSSQR